MESNAELRLPTVAVAVRVRPIATEPLDASLYISDVPGRAHAALCDDLAALLEADAQFVPARTASGVVMFAKHAIAWIAISTATDEVALYDRQHRVAIELVTGERFTGNLLDSAPADRPRVIDHLNGSNRFVRLWTSDSHYAINKAQIRHVMELGELGAPGTTVE